MQTVCHEETEWLAPVQVRKEASVWPALLAPRLLVSSLSSLPSSIDVLKIGAFQTACLVSLFLSMPELFVSSLGNWAVRIACAASLFWCLRLVVPAS